MVKNTLVTYQKFPLTKKRKLVTTCYTQLLYMRIQQDTYKWSATWTVRYTWQNHGQSHYDQSHYGQSHHSFSSQQINVNLNPYLSHLSDLNHVIEFVALIFECRGSDLSRLIAEVQWEQLALSSGVTPSPDIRLAGHAGLDGPPVQNEKWRLCWELPSHTTFTGPPVFTHKDKDRHLF